MRKSMLPFILKNTWCLIASLLSVGGLAQGLQLDSVRYTKVPLAKITANNIGGKIGRIQQLTLPVSESLQGHAPIPEAQGRKAACVGWSIANAITIYRAHRQKNYHAGDISANRYSPAFIYNLINQSGDCTKGASIIDGLDLIRQKGVCLKKTFDYQEGITCANQPPPPAFQEAARYKLQNAYQRVFQRGRDKIKNTKSHIANGNPVIVGFAATPQDGRALRGQALWDPDTQSKNYNGHAMVVVGYDATTFTLMNSYGPSWGTKGFIKITYEAYAQYAREAYVLEAKVMDKILQDRTKGKAVSISGALQLTEYNKTNPTSLPIRYSTADKCYQLDTITDFQLTVTLPTGVYAYIFTTEATTNRIQTWQVEATTKDTIITLPTTFYSKQDTQQTLCVLFSYLPVPDFETQLSRLAIDKKQAFPSVLQRIWPSLLPARNINYAAQRASFQAKGTYEEGYMVPIILSY